MKQQKYLKYILKHKYYVLIGGIKIKASLYRLIVHDLSKFKPEEFISYTNYFYNNKMNEDKFNMAWLKHIHSNKHHQEYQAIPKKDNIQLIEIPQKYILEMIADQLGAGKAIYGRQEVKEQYYNNKDNILLHKNTRKIVEEVINNISI